MTTTASKTETHDARALVETLYDAFFSGDIERWFGFIDESSRLVEVDCLPYGGIHIGPEAIRRAIGIILDCWDEGHFEIIEIFANQTSAAAYGTMHWTARATGRRIAFPLVEHWTFENGKVRDVTPVYGDTYAVLDVLGRLPA